MYILVYMYLYLMYIYAYTDICIYSHMLIWIAECTAGYVG